ncbi:MAG: DUF6352 family protein [Polaromonas sp.]|nr:DUF6352 family protein [Polaromonas sp.]
MPFESLTPPPHWLRPTDDFLRSFLARPELAPVPESCPAELALHAALLAAPAQAVDANALYAVSDADARQSYQLFLSFRDDLLAAGSLEAYYMGLFGGDGSRIAIPPLFIDLLVQAIAGQLLAGSDDAFEHRAADMLHRPQRIGTQDGQVLSGDQTTLDMLSETGGVGDIGRFLFEAGAPMATIDMQVLGGDNAADYFREHLGGHRRHHYLLDLTHEVTHDLSHGLIFKMTRARSGLKALSLVLQKWVRHFLGVAVTIRPLQKIDDEAWRWHIGLDVEATALLNDLYEDREVDAARLQRLVSLFRLDFTDPLEMRADVAGKPVYLGLMMNAGGIVKIKPQNLLINLPLRRAM